MGAKPVRRRLDVEARKAQILAAAHALFAARAYDGVSMDDVADAAGISKSLLFHYFSSKRDLYVAGLRESAAALLAAITAPRESLTPIARATAALDAFLDHVQRERVAFLALMRGGIGSDPDVARIIDDTRAALAAHIRARLEVQVSPAASASIDLALRGWIGMVEAATLAWLAEPAVPRHELHAMLLATLGALMQHVAVQARPSSVAPTPSGRR